LSLANLIVVAHSLCIAQYDRVLGAVGYMVMFGYY